MRNFCFNRIWKLSRNRTNSWKVVHYNNLVISSTKMVMTFISHTKVLLVFLLKSHSVFKLKKRLLRNWSNLNSSWVAFDAIFTKIEIELNTIVQSNNNKLIYKYCNRIYLTFICPLSLSLCLARLSLFLHLLNNQLSFILLKKREMCARMQPKYKIKKNILRYCVLHFISAIVKTYLLRFYIVE